MVLACGGLDERWGEQWPQWGKQMYDHAKEVEERHRQRGG